MLIVDKIHPAYIAGIIDSDGSLSVVKRHNIRLNVNYHTCFQLSWKFSESAENFMNKLKKEYGGSVYKYIKKQNSLGGEITIVKYYCQGKHLKPLLELVLPYLVLKKQQALNILEIRNQTVTGKYGSGRPKPEHIKIKQEEIFQLNRQLNTKNGKERKWK